MSRLLIAAGLSAIFLLIVLSFLGILSWVVTGVLSTVVIGVVGWILNYLSKIKEKTEPTIKEEIARKTEQSKQPRTILEETCEIEGEEYVYYDLILDEGKEVKGEVSSDEAVNLYFLTKYGFDKFDRNEDFSYEYGAEGMVRKKIHFNPSRTGTWYLVIENEGEDPAIVDVHLFV